MAMLNALDVSVGKPLAAGGIHAGPTTATVPTDATTPLDEDIVGLGYVSDQGLTNGIAMTTSDVTAWGGDTVLTVRTARTETFTWSFIETNAAVMAQVYGPDNVTETNGELVVLHTNDELPNQLYVFEIAMTGNKVKRIVVPNGKITEISDVSYVDGDPIAYGVTLNCFPDENGVTVYEYIASVENGS